VLDDDDNEQDGSYQNEDQTEEEVEISDKTVEKELDKPEENTFR